MTSNPNDFLDAQAEQRDSDQADDAHAAIDEPVAFDQWGKPIFASDCEDDVEYDDEPWDGFLTDAEADADALASAGWGTDEDYGGGCEHL